MRTMLSARFASMIAVVFAILGAVFMFFVGSVTTVKGIGIYFGTGEARALSSTAALEATVDVVTALDQFLLGLSLIVFAFGVFGLFVVADRSRWDETSESIGRPGWLRVESVTDLKVMLLEVVAVIVAVLFLKIVLDVANGADLPWNALILPAAVVLFGITVWLFRSAEH